MRRQLTSSEIWELQNVAEKKCNELTEGDHEFLMGLSDEELAVVANHAAEHVDPPNQEMVGMVGGIITGRCLAAA